MSGRQCSGMLVVAAAVVLAGCARYERKPLAFVLPEDMGNAVSLDGALIGARVIGDRDEAKAAFGFDIIKGGVLPVQVVIQNNGEGRVSIEGRQTFLVEDGSGGVPVRWPVLQQDVAVERISAQTDWGEIAPQAGRGALLGTAAGTLGGLAIGILTGTRTRDAVAGGAVVGGAAGALLGGAKGRMEHEMVVERQISRDLAHRSLDNKDVQPGDIGHGVIFFGTEAKQPRTLELRVRTASGERQVELAL